MDVIIIESFPPVVEIRNDERVLHSQECTDYDQAVIYANGCIAGLNAVVQGLGSLPLGFKNEIPPRVAAARAMIGKNVRLKTNPAAGIAKVADRFEDVDGGLLLETPLDGSRGWNLNDLEVVAA